MRVVSTKIPDNVYNMLSKIAEEEGMSVSVLLKKLIYEYLGIEGRPEVYHSSLPSGRLGKTKMHHSCERINQVMDKLNAIERMLDLIHANIAELYNACVSRRKLANGQQTLEESVKKSDTSDVYKPSDVWKGFKEEAIKLFEEIFNEYVQSKRKRGGR